MSESIPPSPDVDVRHLAHLARMRLSDQEVSDFSSQIGEIIGYFRQLDTLDVSDIEPMAHTTPVDNVFRADEPATGLDRADVLANAPASRNHLILVPKILE